MKITGAKICEKAISPHPEKIVRRSDEFPELAQALRNGDQASARWFFDQLFDGDSDQLEARHEGTAAQRF
jgi:hypothetical protein